MSMDSQQTESLFLRDVRRGAFVVGGVAAAAGGPLTLAAYLPVYVGIRTFIKKGFWDGIWWVAGTAMAVGAAASFIGDNVDKAEKRATIAAEGGLSSSNKQTSDCENYSRRKYFGWGRTSGEVCVTLNYIGQNGDDLIASWSTTKEMLLGGVPQNRTIVVFDPKHPEKFRKLDYNLKIN
jgi:hypothetical protein